MTLPDNTAGTSTTHSDQRRCKRVTITLAWIKSRCEVTPAGCWIWKGRLDRDGYGELRERGPRERGKRVVKYRRVHRRVWELVHGPIPKDMLVLHDCPDGNDNMACCCPDHLWLGDDDDNAKDKIAKGREWHGGPRRKVEGIDTLVSQTTKTEKRHIFVAAEGPLTRRQTEVILLMACGLSYRTIGETLGITKNMATQHGVDILRKLDAKNRYHAADWAIKNGLLERAAPHLAALGYTPITTNFDTLVADDQAEGNTDSIDEVCSTDKCTRKATRRGKCATCYAGLRRLVKRGLVTWAELVAAGHCTGDRKPRRRSGYLKKVLADVAQLRRKSADDSAGRKKEGTSTGWTADTRSDGTFGSVALAR